MRRVTRKSDRPHARGEGSLPPPPVPPPNGVGLRRERDMKWWELFGLGYGRDEREPEPSLEEFISDDGVVHAVVVA